MNPHLKFVEPYKRLAEVQVGSVRTVCNCQGFFLYEDILDLLGFMDGCIIEEQHKHLALRKVVGSEVSDNLFNVARENLTVDHVGRNMQCNYAIMSDGSNDTQRLRSRLIVHEVVLSLYRPVVQVEVLLTDLIFIDEANENVVQHDAVQDCRCLKVVLLVVLGREGLESL